MKNKISNFISGLHKSFSEKNVDEAIKYLECYIKEDSVFISSMALIICALPFDYPEMLDNKELFKVLHKAIKENNEE